MSRGALEIEALHHTVPDGSGRRTILDGVDLSLRKGESVYLTGPSGSGKSTLLSIAGLLIRAERGKVRILGTEAQDLNDRRRTRLRRESVSFIYQSANLLPSLTALEQLGLMAHIRGESRREATQRAKRLLESVGLTGRENQLPAELSGGERQRVGIARALMCRPSLILADEPTASLDPGLAGEIHDLLIERARQSDIATLVVTHDERAARRADRRLHLEDGRLHEREAAPV